MSELYDVSDEVLAMAKKLIEDHHGHLVDARIKYLFRTGNWEIKKRDTWGQAKKAGKEMNFLTGYDFIILLHQDVWEQLTPEHKEALLDHELQHCSAGTDDAGNKTWYIQGHDVEDFLAIIRRHGLWSPALKKIETALEMRNQTELDFGEEGAADPASTDLVVAGEPVRRPQHLRLVAGSSGPDYIDVESEEV